MKSIKSYFVEVDKFSVWYGGCQVLGLLVLFMMLSWCAYYQGGIGWRWSDHEANLHPFMMTLGFIYLLSNSLMVYRGFKSFSKLRLKQMHAALHILALGSVIIGLIAMWDYKNYRGYPNLKSLHSWLGLITLILFVIQWVYSFGVFLFPGAPLHMRSRFMNPHVFMGMTIFILACVTALLGLFGESSWNSKYKNSQVYANILGLFICGFAGTVIYIVTKSDFKRLDYHM